jgi:hypothetical protein
MARKKTREPATDENGSELSGSLVYTVSAIAAAIYYFSNPKPQNFYDYTFRVAENLLGGRIGFAEKPPQWLNEFVPFDGLWYSVFPFGSVVSMLPFAALKSIGVVSGMPAAFIAAMCAGVSCLFMLLISRAYDIDKTRAILLSLAMVFGTWTWTNVTFGGAWQLALAFAMLGELGAIYFTLVDRRPLVAGAFFALAFGNRTEILLTAPIFLYWLAKKSTLQKTDSEGISKNKVARYALTHPPRAEMLRRGPRDVRASAFFCLVPFVLGIATLIYNYLRFNSITDFGYARIPGVLNEPWYNHGIFSPVYIPRQMWEMLFKLWEFRPAFSLPMPNPFSSSILISSPFLLFAFRTGYRDRVIKYSCWIAVSLICLLLWMHGNSGGWQFGYRYAGSILPFLFVIMLENAPKKISPLEWAAFGFSFVANAYATWLFHWTEILKP